MKKSNHRFYITGYDKTILFAYLSLTIIGLLIMLDISSVRNSMIYFYRQLAYVGVSVVVMLFLFQHVNLNKLKVLNSVLIGVSIAFLVIVLFKGESVKGATRSINLGIVNFQPSFLARVALIFFYAQVICNKHEELKKAGFGDFIKNFLPLLVITGIIFGLILKGQHLSSLVISGATLVCLLFLGELKSKLVITALVVCLLAGIGVIKLGAKYRSDRLDIYKKYCILFKGKAPVISPGKEYQVKESITALSSGRITGTGPDRGRAKHYYLPEARTDYVFTVIGEEFGFLGAMLVFGLHCLLFFKIMLMAMKQTDVYLKLLAMGLALNIFLNVLVNVGVSMSILPSTGNTLPFISYSGTAMVIDSAAVGVVLNISAKRKMI